MDNTTLALYNRLFLALFFSFVAIFYICLIIIKQSKSKHKVVHKGARYSAHWYNHAAFGLFRAAILIICIARIFAPQIDQWLIAFDMPQSIIFTGQMLMIMGFGLAMTASMTMKNAWRSGIDTTNSAPLVDYGLYSRVRNPNYLGVQMAQVGFFLALPSGFTLVCLIVGWMCIHIQVKLEEKQLLKIYGDSYIRYQNKTHRWLPFAPYYAHVK